MPKRRVGPDVDGAGGRADALLHYPEAGVEVDSERRRITRDGDEVRLSRTEWELFEQLAGNVESRE